METYEELPTPKVYAAILNVMEKLAKEGISKSRKNEQQGYKFRGIDEVYNALSPFLAEAGLVILPRFSDRQVVERTSAKDKALFYVTLQGEFDLVSPEDGSKVTVGPFYGEAMDSGDKATNKAMSAAFKYMAMEVFCIPTEGDNDADSTTHEVQASVVTKWGSNGAEVCKIAFDGLPPDEQVSMKLHASIMLEMSDADAVTYMRSQKIVGEDKLALWHLLPATRRAGIKKIEVANPTTSELATQA